MTDITSRARRQAAERLLTLLISAQESAYNVLMDDVIAKHLGAAAERLHALFIDPAPAGDPNAAQERHELLAAADAYADAVLVIAELSHKIKGLVEAEVESLSEQTTPAAHAD